MIDYRNTFVEVDNSIIENNARILCEAFPHEYNIGVIKGNAYGHGYGVVPALIKGGINAFAVSNLNEALEVRKYDKEHPVIMLQPVHKEYLELCSKESISVCVNDKETFEDIVSSGFKLLVQIKVDCGMNRLGFKDTKEFTDVFNATLNNPNLVLEGVFSHFHTAGITDSEYEKNLNKFKEITANVDLTKAKMVHVDKTQTLILHETPSFANAARIGIALFGFTTVHDFPGSLKGKIRKFEQQFKNKKNNILPCKPIKEYPVKPAFKLISEVIQVKETEVGEYVGYGLTHCAAQKEYVATVDVGYADGLSKKRLGTNVAINGKVYPIIGIVGMGMIEVLADETIKKYDRVTVLGGEVPIVSITRHQGCSMYELMTQLDFSIPRKYI